MTEVTAKRRNSLRLATIFVAACSWLSLASAAEGRPYTVFSCDSANLFGHSSTAWAPFANAGSTYATCPTGGGMFAGISDRLTGKTYSGFNFSGHAFTAPPGTSITSIKWAGRMARESCSWGTYIRALPSDSAFLGLPFNQFCMTSGLDTRAWPMLYPVPSGTTRLEQLTFCGARECAPGATMHTHSVEVTIEDPHAPSISLSGPLASGQWVSARTSPHVAVATQDASGTAVTHVAMSGKPQTETYACNASLPAPCPGDVRTTASPSIADLPDGRHRLTVSATDYAGNASTAGHDVLVDSTPPDPVVPAIQGGLSWRRTNGFVATWIDPPGQAAPLTRVHWKLCASQGDCGTASSKPVSHPREVRLSTPAAGEYMLRVWLEDAAGNQREANSALAVPLRFDPEAPNLTFQPVNAEDPLRVVVDAADRHSGVAGGQIEMRAAGASTWHVLATQFLNGQLVAYVDDERFRQGTYEFRAHVVDHAGNEASTGSRADGTAASLRLPARVDTQLRVGLLRTFIRRRVVHRHGQRHIIRKQIRRLDTRVTARHMRTLRLSGRLANTDGQPMTGATIEALDHLADGSLLPLGFATTGELGRFRYIVGANRNRRIQFRYAGSRRTGTAKSNLEVFVPAASSMQSSHTYARNGERVVFSGRVATLPVPVAGKLVELQAYFRGRWRTFSTLRTTPTGRWRFPYRFGATSGRVTYRFRVVLPAEGGYPFIGGRSRVVRVVVTGR